MRQRIKCFNRSTWVMLLVMLVFIVSTKWIRINVQPSVAMGVYMVQALPRTLERGMLVVLPTPAVMRPWHSRDLLKPVAGVAQDQVCLLSVGLWINGEPYGGIYTEAYGNPYPGCVAVSWCLKGRCSWQVRSATRSTVATSARFVVRTWLRRRCHSGPGSSPR